MPPRAFLSHSTKDAELADALAKDLRSAGVDVWYSRWEINPGDSLRRKIDAGIDAASHFMVLLTPHSLGSEWVQTELDAGLVNKISGRCRLIPVVSGVGIEQVPATLRGLLWVRLDSYADGLRKLLEVCHDVSVKPPLGQPPVWARERPLRELGLSANAQRLAAWLNEQSEHGTQYDLFERDAVLKDLDLAPDQAGLAASELEDEYMVKLGRDSGSGTAGFSYVQPEPLLFFRTDPALRGWNPEADAVELAAAMVNLGRQSGVALAEVDRLLGWGPRRINPAADYLDSYGYVEASKTCGSAPYTYAYAFISHRTQRFTEAGGLESSSMKIEGLDDVAKTLERLADRARALEGTHSVPVTELLTPAFIQAHTRGHKSVDEWFAASPFRIESTDDFSAIPDAAWEAYVQATTDFPSWEEMLGAAGKEYFERRLLGTSE